MNTSRSECLFDSDSKITPFIFLLYCRSVTIEAKPWFVLLEIAKIVRQKKFPQLLRDIGRILNNGSPWNEEFETSILAGLDVWSAMDVPEAVTEFHRFTGLSPFSTAITPGISADRWARVLSKTLGIDVSLDVVVDVTGSPFLKNVDALLANLSPFVLRCHIEFVVALALGSLVSFDLASIVYGGYNAKAMHAESCFLVAEDLIGVPLTVPYLSSTLQPQRLWIAEAILTDVVAQLKNLVKEASWMGLPTKEKLLARLSSVKFAWTTVEHPDWEALYDDVPDMGRSFLANWKELARTRFAIRNKMCAHGDGYRPLRCDGTFNDTSNVLVVPTVRMMPPLFYDRVEPTMGFGFLGSWAAGMLAPIFDKLLCREPLKHFSRAVNCYRESFQQGFLSR